MMKKATACPEHTGRALEASRTGGCQNESYTWYPECGIARLSRCWDDLALQVSCLDN